MTITVLLFILKRSNNKSSQTLLNNNLNIIRNVKWGKGGGVKLSVVQHLHRIHCGSLVVLLEVFFAAMVDTSIVRFDHAGTVRSASAWA